MKPSSYIPGTRAWRHRREGILCAQTVERIQEIVDGEIGASRAELVLTRHLAACKSCNDHAEVIKELKIAIVRVSDDADPALVTTLEDLARKLCQGE